MNKIQDWPVLGTEPKTTTKQNKKQKQNRKKKKIMSYNHKFFCMGSSISC